MAGLKSTSETVLRDIAAKDAFTQKVYDSFKASMINSMEWGKLSEEAYTRARREY